MEVDFLTTLINVAILVALATPGFILRKKKMLPETAVKTLVVVLIYACQPFLSITSFLEKEYAPSLLVNMGIAFVSALVLHIAVYYVTKLILMCIRPKNGATDEERESVIRTRKSCNVCSFLGNIGFMGIPVMRALFPQYPEMIMYAAVVVVAFNITSWTFGVYTITGNRKDMSLKSAFLNPAVITLVVALPLFFFKSYIPVGIISPVERGMGYLANMTLPISMLVVGIRLADMNFIEVVSDARVYLVCSLKLVLAPLMALSLMLIIRLIVPSLSVTLIISLYITMAMPCATMSLNFAELFGGDTKVALKSVLLSTLLSVITIPLLMLLCFVV